MNTLRDFIVFMGELSCDLRYRLKYATWRGFVEWWTEGINLIRLLGLIGSIAYLLYIWL